MADQDIFGSLGKLSEPVTRIVERVDDALRRAREPRLIERMARAEVKAELIRAEGEILKEELYLRAAKRLVQEELISQENIESVLLKSGAYLPPEVDPSGMSDGWVRRFIDRVKHVSDEEMQDLWAKLIAGEASNPGAFSKRAIDVLDVMDQSDAVAFERLASCSVGQPNPLPIVFDLENAVYKSAGVTFTDLVNLEQLGLLSFNAITGFERRGLSQKTLIRYFQRDAQLELKKQGKDSMYVLQLGKVLLTRVGTELSRLVTGEPVDGFLDYILSEWEKMGHKVLSMS